MNVGDRIGQYLLGRRPRGTSGAEEQPATAVLTSGAEFGEAEESPAGGEETLPIGAGQVVEEWRETMDDERMQILKMVEEHKVTAEEASKLLAALDSGARPAEMPFGRAPRWIRIRVTDMVTGRSKVNVNVPIGVITAAGKLGARFGFSKMAEKEGINLEELFDAIRSGAEGKLVDVTNEENTEHVEIYVE